MTEASEDDDNGLEANEDLELDLAATFSKVLRVLIVEDAESQRLILLKQVRTLGFDTVAAIDGQDAADKLDDYRPHIIISDWFMPRMDGIELCRLARASNRGRLLYIILLTAHSDDDRLVEAFEAGADDFLAKPVNVRELEGRLRAAKRIITLQSELRRKIESLRELNSNLTDANRRLFDVAHQDALTGLPNRRLMVEQLRQAWAGYQRRHKPFALALVDIDHFKRVNDDYGHDAGDKVLTRIGKILRRQIRAEDSVARFGGEEFLILMPDTDVDAAARLAERVRAAIAGESFIAAGREWSVTASVGIASTAQKTLSWESLFKAADVALYEAKAAGRDRVCG
ncbi:MAG: diguanylate cyclase [Gammaproteobacteria bacterium]